MDAAKDPNFAPRLKELREAAGLTQEQLAERAKLHKLTVAKLEQGIRQPSWVTVQALAAALGVDCLAFQEPPETDRPPSGRGRPSKATPPEAEQQPKRGRGRPPKGTDQPEGKRGKGGK
jgi:transcriptional regulator with XRE-family HTH domain